MSWTITYKNFIHFFCCLMMAAMVLSPVLLSISMLGLSILAVFKIEVLNGKAQFSLHNEGIQRMKSIFRYPSFVAVFLFFVVTLLWFYPIGDMKYLLARLRIKVPFVVFPLIFLALPRFSYEDFKKMLYFLLVFFSIVSVGILINYFLHFEFLTEQIKKGHHIPTPRNHIRYSLLAAWSIIGGIYLIIKKYQLKYDWERWLIIGLTSFMFLFLHLLTVKSGLLVLYICLGFGILQYIWLKKQFIFGLIGLFFLLAIPFGAYHTIPSFQNKVKYFRYDMFMHERGEGDNYSDSGRIISIEAGWAIAKENWLLGVGTSNMRNEVYDYYEKNNPNYPEVFMPQNQFLFSWGSAGVFGLLLTIVAFFTPLFYRQNYKHPLFLNYYLSIFVIIMIEHALENAVGVAHYLFFLMFFLNFLNRDSLLKAV